MPDDNASEPDDYELVPYKDIQELKEDLKRLKEMPIPTTKKLQVSMDDLAAKIDRLTAIFEEASHQIKVEEGGLSFQDKMKPLVERMSKILEQNSEIAKGIVAVADLVSDLKSGTRPEPDLLRPEPMLRPDLQRTAPFPPPPKRKFGFL